MVTTLKACEHQVDSNQELSAILGAQIKIQLKFQLQTIMKHPRLQRKLLYPTKE